jgi:hypothetical protein
MWFPGVDESSLSDLQGTYFGKQFDLQGPPLSGQVLIAVDDFAEVAVNGMVAGSSGSITDHSAASAAQSALKDIDLTPYLVPGLNTITIKAQNGPYWFSGYGCNPCSYGGNPAGLVFGGTIRVGTTPPTTCLAPPPGLVSWWPGDGDPFDIRGGHSGTLSNGASFTPGQVLEAFNFDGVDDHVDVDDQTGLLSSAPLTIDAWIKPNAIHGGSRIVSKDLSTEGCDHPHVVFSLDARGEAGNVLVFFFTVSGGGLSSVVGQTPIPLGEFSHVAATYDGQEARVYLNGVMDGAVTVAGPLATSSAPFVIGNGGAGCRATDGSGIAFSGEIDELDVFNRALEASEIAAIYAAGSMGKCKAGGPTQTQQTTWGRLKARYR